MSFARSILVGETTYRSHEAVGISHERGSRTVVHVISTDRADGEGRSLDSWHVHEIDDALTFEAAEEWLKTLDAFREHSDPYQEAIEQLAPTLTDEQSIAVPWAYPEWSAEGSYEAGQRVRYEGALYKVLQSHDAQESWNPPAAPSLFARVLSGTSGETPEWEQPESTNPYMAGDRVTHGGKTWESTIDNNVWEPGVYGWEEV